MEIPEDFETVWTGIVTPNQPFEVKTTEESALTIRNLCLYVTEETPKQGRVLLYVKVDDKEEVCIAPFTIGSLETVNVDITLMFGEKAVFTVKGEKANVHMCGFISGAFELETKGAGEPLVESPSAEK